MASAATPSPAPTGSDNSFGRIFGAIFSPKPTFESIAQRPTWIVPLILIILVSALVIAVFGQRVGWRNFMIRQNQQNSRAQKQMEQMTPDQRAMNAKISLGVTEGIFIAYPVFALGGIALLSLGLWGTINFGFGGKATYGSIFSMWFYASLPGIIKPLLGTIVIFAGATPETFNIKNYAPTNVAAFLNPTETNAALYSLASSLDIITIWTLVLLGIGAATVAGVKRSSGYIAVFGWWAIFVVIGAGFAAITG